MNFKKHLPLLAALLCICLVLAGCNLRAMFGSNQQTPTNGIQTISTAIVISEIALLYDEPCGNPVGQLANGTTVTFTETVNTGAEILVRCESPVADTWVLLSDLQVTSGGSMSIVYNPDGSAIGGNVHMVVGPNGEMVVVKPGTQDEDVYYPITDPDDPYGPDAGSNSYDLSLLEGVWGYVPYDEYGYHGTVTTWYLGANGYALLEVGTGEINGNTFYINYTDLRLFGTYSVVNGVFTFTATEDWYYSHGQNIGRVFTYDFSETGNGFALDGNEYTPFNTTGYYLDDVTGHRGGPTGNDLTDPNYEEPVLEKIPDEVLGTWVSFERNSSGQQIRRLWTFQDPQTNNHPCSYLEDTFDQIGGEWVILPVSFGTAFYYDNYYMLNGQMYVEYGPESIGPYDLSIQGDTLVITYTDWNGVTSSHTYSRTTSSNPTPN